MGNLISLAAPPRRIISLVPSQTEFLFDLGLDEEIIGITKFCIHPGEKVKNKTRIGGTKQFKFEVIDQLNPDLIIGNKEENYKEGIEQLQAKYPVWMSDIYTLADACAMMRSLGELTGRREQARKIVDEIEAGFAALSAPAVRPRVLYLIWKEPYMCAGKETFIDEMISAGGFINCLEHVRYPSLTDEEIRVLQPDIIMLSSEPYPFREKHVAEFRQLCPSAQVRIVDGELFSWYGSRLRETAGYLKKIIY